MSSAVLRIFLFVSALTSQFTFGTESKHLPHLQRDVCFLTEAAQKLLIGCRVKAHDGTILYTPDGKANYNALWTRDFAYMVENAHDLIPPEHIEACIRYLLKGQRADGAIPDRVDTRGVPVYSGGPENSPLGEPNLDNTQFIVIAADEYLRSLPPKRSRALFSEWADQLDKGMDYLPRSGRGLIFNDPKKPHSPYGFTDTVGKTGELFMESLLYWTACSRLTDWHKKIGGNSKANEFHRRAKLIERNISTLWNETSGMFFAATIDCRQTDIWANAYALHTDFPLGRKAKQIREYLVRNYDSYVWRGQIRHLPKGEYWQRMLAPVGHETYQNGAYWATASGWVMQALKKTNPESAEQLFADLIADFRTHGIFECVNENNYRQLDTYVVSATNPLGAIRKMSLK